VALVTKPSQTELAYNNLDSIVALKTCCNILSARPCCFMVLRANNERLQAVKARFEFSVNVKNESMGWVDYFHCFAFIEL